MSASCNPDGTSTITFEASGLATGPITGTFTETGTATVGPQTPSPEVPVGKGTLTSFTAEFTIYSLEGEVIARGTKELLAEVALGGTCQDEPRHTRFVDIPEGVRCTAEIVTPDGGRFVDQGSATVNVAEVEATGELPGLSTFVERFKSQPMPTSEEQCKNGGFDNFGFENQGACVIFVENQ